MVILERYGSIPTMGTFGRLWIEGTHFKCLTVECPDLNNTPGKSCIPKGTYPLRLSHYYAGGYPAFEICDVPNRSRILIHIANTINDIKGCVGLGDRFGWVVGKWAVLNSKQTLSAFMGAMENITETEIEVR
jgi:hypothetical protein